MIQSITYELLNGTEENPIKIVVDSSAEFATISWSYNVIVQCGCSSFTTKGSLRETVVLIPNTTEEEKTIKNSIKWKDDIDVFYWITQKAYVAPPTPCEPTVLYELIEDDNSTWVTPYDIYCNRESHDIKLHYEYYEITKCDDKEVKRERKKKEISINPTLDCSTEGSERVEIEVEAPEGFMVKSAINRVLNYASSCSCADFSFDENTCGCSKFEFLDEDCNCENFNFLNEDCSCDDFKFEDKG